MSKLQTEGSIRIELDIENEENILEKFLDLSLREILLLFFIMRFPGEILRNALREEVNDYLKKDFSTSSFYNILEKLEKKKLIIVKDGKIVQVTEQAKKIIFELNRLTLICQIDFRGITENIIPLVLNRLGNSSIPAISERIKNSSSGTRIFSQTLILNLEIMMDVNVLNAIKDSITEKLFVLSTVTEFKRYQSRGLDEKIQQSQILDEKIREANEFFDAIIIIGYTSLSKYPEKTKLLLMNELKRVVKRGGILFLVSDIHPEIKGEHFVLDMVNKLIRNADFLAIINKDDMLNDIAELGFTNHDAIEHKGMIVGWGILDE